MLEILSIKETKAFLLACDRFYRVYFFIHFYGGLRGNEAKHLRWRDVDFQRGTLRVLGKGNKLRMVPFDNTLRLALLSIKPEQPDDQYVFPSRRKKLEGRPNVDAQGYRTSEESGRNKQENNASTCCGTVLRHTCLSVGMISSLSKRFSVTPKSA